MFGDQKVGWTFLFNNLRKVCLLLTLTERENNLRELKAWLQNIALISALSLLYTLFFTPCVQAQESYQPYPLGLRTAGMGGAAAAFGKDSAMSWWNPAGIAANQGQSFGASANGMVLDMLSVENYFRLSDRLQESLGTDDDTTRSRFESRSLSLFPNSVSYALTIAPNHYLALSMIVPYRRTEDSLVEILIDPSAGIYTEYYSDGYRELNFYEFGPSYAVRFSPTSRFGISAMLRYGSYLSIAAQENVNQETASKTLTLFSRESSFRGTSYDLDIGAGFQFGPYDGFSIGFSFHAPSIHLTGEMRRNRRTYVASGGSALVLIEDEEVTADDYILKTPPWFVFGIGYESPKRWAVALDASYWMPIEEFDQYDGQLNSRSVSTVPEQRLLERAADVTLARQYGGVLNLNLGFEAYLSERTILRVGAFTDRSNQPLLPLEEERVTSDIGTRMYDRYGATLGLAQGTNGDALQLGLVFLYGQGEMVGWRYDPVDPTYPTETIVATSVILNFSGQLDASALFEKIASPSKESIPAQTAPSPQPKREKKKEQEEWY